MQAPQTPPHSSVDKVLDAFLLWALNPFSNFPELLLLQSQIVEFVKIFASILVQFKGAKKHQKKFL
jgi:hypothetical protein